MNVLRSKIESREDRKEERERERERSEMSGKDVETRETKPVSILRISWQVYQTARSLPKPCRTIDSPALFRA